MHVIRRALRRAHALGHMRGVNHRGLPDRQLDVLHEERADAASWVLVCVSPSSTLGTLSNADYITD